MTDIAFLGLGIMGRPMAGHLQRAGHRLFVVKHRSDLPAELLHGGAVECQNFAEAAERAEVVITIVTDTPDVEQVLFAEGGVAEGLERSGGQGKLVIDMSTISPTATKDFARRIEATGAQYLDAPVSGGDVGAIEASLTIMVGGPEDAYVRARPLFDLMGGTVTRIGDNGAGQICKLTNQIIVALTVEAVSEALVFAAKAGVDPAVVRQALMGGFAKSRILEIHGARMLERDFAPGFKIALHQKDLDLVLRTARENGVALPSTAMAQQLYNARQADGGADEDVSGMVQALEKLAGVTVG